MDNETKLSGGEGTDQIRVRRLYKYKIQGICLYLWGYESRKKEYNQREGVGDMTNVCVCLHVGGRGC